ncbi:hypothetical protein [Streptomyces sp. NPDC088925]|uniref:hypothetical protein n=1 Tax=Streptomyces sp. NPDC088925 TaxID=3365914 RepID=UPI00381A8794
MIVVEKPYLAGVQEIGRIFHMKPTYASVCLADGRFDPQPDPLIVSGSRYWLLGDVRVMRTPTKTADPIAIGELEAGQRPGRMAVTGDELPVIVGLAELGEVFDTKATSVQSMLLAGGWREPDWRLSGSPLWLLEPLVAPGVDPRGDGMPRARRSWEPDHEVVASLRAGTYTGPGSTVRARGRAAGGK